MNNHVFIYSDKILEVINKRLQSHKIKLLYTYQITCKVIAFFFVCITLNNQKVNIIY